MSTKIGRCLTTALLASIIGAGVAVGQLDEPNAGRMAEIVAALRVEEAKYRDVDYALKITSRTSDPSAPGAAGAVTSEETRRIVLQGDRVRLEESSTAQIFASKVRREEVSGFDGEKTRTVVSGNSANIHLGRFEHPDVYPAHCVPLIHYRLNFPLSTYLSGTDAIRSHPKYGRFEREGGSTAEFTKVEARFEGEEDVNGLRCLRIRVDRWYYSKDVPVLQYLWLCPSRNYLCLKETLAWPGSMFGGLPLHEMWTEDLREVMPGLWFPSKLTVVDYDRQSLRQKKPRIREHTETVVERISFAPHHNDDFFKDVPIPAELPVFTLRDGSLIGSSRPEPVGGAEEQAKLDEIVARVREQEKRYEDLQVVARETYRHVGTDLFMEGIITEQSKTLRSVLRGPLAYFASNESFTEAGGTRSESAEEQAFDGRWTRTLRRNKRGGQEGNNQATLRKGGGRKAEGRHDGIPVLRPHTFLVRDDWLYGPLADLLVSPWHDKVNKYRLRFRYCGEEVLDGHPCVKLRGDILIGEGDEPHNTMAFWLATDRNYIPIKMEQYGGNVESPTTPTGLHRSDDFREIAPSLWYPFRSTMLAFNNRALASKRLTLNWRRDFAITSVELSPGREDAFFRVVVPAGTQVQVVAEDGNLLGQFEQGEEGVPEIDPARYLPMLANAKVRDDEQQARQAALQDLVGKPAPEFPEGATWLNGGPLSWKTLRGKVVVLDFWAEWCGPCRNDLPRTAGLHASRETNGLTVIGVHPPGSDAGSIKQVMDEFHLEYPICVDVTPQEGKPAWGDLYGKFAVQAIPHAVAIDAGGRIAAFGRLEDVISKAVALRNKGK